MAIRGGKVRSMKSLKSGLKKGGGAGYLSRVPADGSLTVRFLTEPTEWVEYYEHFDQVKKFYPCTDDCDGCRAGETPSRRYLANALDVAENKVIPLVLPKTLAGSVTKKYDKYATLLDRDYELSREGTGFDTEYDVTPEPPSKVNVGRYDLLDLWALLEAQLESDGEDDEDDDEDDEPKSKRPAKKTAPSRRASRDDDDEDDDDEDDEDEDDEPAPKSRRTAPSKRRAVEEDDEDEEDEEEEDEEEEDDDEVWTRDELDGKGIRELRKIALESGYTTDDYKGLDVEGVIDLILGEGEDEEDEEEDDEDVLTEDDLKAMSLAELKKMAKEYDVTVKAGVSKADLIDLILDAAGEEDDDNPPF